MAANCLPGLLPFRPGALGIAQPHDRKIKVVSSHRATRWSSPAARFTHEQSRAKLAAFVNSIPRSWYRTYFLWTKVRLTTQHGPRRSGVRTFSAQLPLQRESAWPMLCEAAMHGPLFSAPYLLKEHPDGKSNRRKLPPKGGKPPQTLGMESTSEASDIVQGLCDVPLPPTCEGVKGVTVVLTLLPVRWQSSNLAGEP